MSHISKRFSALAALLLVGLLVGCEDEIPTAVGGDLFPDGTRPVTIEVSLSSSRFMPDDTVFSGYTSPRDANFLLVADRFDQVLSAHGLVEFVDFPDTVTFSVGDSTHKDAIFTYVAGRVTAQLDTLSSTEGPVQLQLWELDQEWDSASVTWDHAVNTGGSAVPWNEPGGSRGELLAETTWMPGDTLTADTVVWQLSASAMAQISEASPGLLVTSATPGSRVQISNLALTTEISPSSKPDTTLVRDVSAGPPAFIVTPAPPTSPAVWEVGGLSSSRGVFSLDPAQEVPTCAPTEGITCPMIPLSEVTLNYAALVLESQAVPSGYRPLRTVLVTLRRLFDPDIGSRAPLGSVVSVDSAFADLFVAGSEGTVELTITQPLRAILESDSTATLAILAEPEGTYFGEAWFTRSPRLRLIFTLPLESSLP